MPEFNDDVSPWNTRQSMRTSDDVAQLLVSDRTVIKPIERLTERLKKINLMPNISIEQD